MKRIRRLIQFLKDSCGHKRAHTQRGVTLVEALIATALLGVGFAGIYTMTAVSAQSLNYSIVRQKLQMQANQILDVVEADRENMDSYAMDLASCTEPEPDEDEGWVLRQYEWCSRMEGEVGAAQGDMRAIDITTLPDGRRVLHVVLEGYAGRVQVVMKRIFDG